MLRVPEPDWGSAPPFGRRETLLRTLRRLWELHPGPASIVETGSLRSDVVEGMLGDGWSTMAWGWYCSQVGGTAYTIDIKPDVLEICRQVTAPYQAHLRYLHGDSVPFLEQWPQHSTVSPDGSPAPIHLLYLDSLDYVDTEESEAHNLAEALAALPHLAKTALLLIDDMRSQGAPDSTGLPPFSGKGRRTAPYLVERGWRVEWYAGDQLLLGRYE